MLSARGQDPKTQIKGGVEGKVQGVDVSAQTVTITTTEGRQRTFTITDETTMVGPRGGKVRRRLKDPRFQEGIPVTIVANGNTASEIHLGFHRQQGGDKGEHAQTPNRDSERPVTDRTAQPSPRTGRATRPAATTRTENYGTEETKGGKGKAAAKPADDDEDNEVPGKVKRFDSTRHMLVITMLNGKDRSFLLSRDVKVLVGDAESRQGLRDPALRSGASIEVVTDEGGHKVKELKIIPASEGRRRKAG
jgi:hypothetical protein